CTSTPFASAIPPSRSFSSIAGIEAHRRLAPRAEDEQVPPRRADAAVRARVAFVELDERPVERLALLGVEPAEQRDHGRRRGREELPDLLARARLEPERPVLELELELLAEHVLDVVLASPLVRLPAVERLVGEATVELAELGVRLPPGEPDATAGARHAAQLVGDVRVVGREDEAERRRSRSRPPRAPWRASARRCRAPLRRRPSARRGSRPRRFPSRGRARARPAGSRAAPRAARAPA